MTTTTADDWHVEMVSIREIQPPHRVTNGARYERIAAQMAKVGWQGRPLLLIHVLTHFRALTGSHRLAAAHAAGIERVPCVLVQRPLDGLEVLDASDDEDLAARLVDLGELEAADLMQLEIRANAETHALESQMNETPDDRCGSSPERQG